MRKGKVFLKAVDGQRAGAGAEAEPVAQRPDLAKAEGSDLIPQIEHIVVVMQENHSYDSYFGMLGRGDGFRLDQHGAPTASNPDANFVNAVLGKEEVGCPALWGLRVIELTEAAWKSAAANSVVQVEHVGV